MRCHRQASLQCIGQCHHHRWLYTSRRLSPDPTELLNYAQSSALYSRTAVCLARYSLNCRLAMAVLTMLNFWRLFPFVYCVTCFTAGVSGLQSLCWSLVYHSWQLSFVNRWHLYACSVWRHHLLTAAVLKWTFLFVAKCQTLQSYTSAYKSEQLTVRETSCTRVGT